MATIAIAAASFAMTDPQSARIPFTRQRRLCLLIFLIGFMYSKGAFLNKYEYEYAVHPRRRHERGTTCLRIPSAPIAVLPTISRARAFRLYAKQENPKQKATIPRAPYRLGGQAYLGHDQAKEEHSLNDRDAASANGNSTLQAQQVHLTNATTNLTQFAKHTALAPIANVSKTENMTASSLNTTMPQSNASKTSTAAVGPYKTSQPFFSTWTYDMTKKPSSKSVKPKNNVTSSSKNDDPLSNMKQDQVLTVADLQQILQSSGYVRQTDLMETSGATKMSDDKTVKLKSGKIAMPQVSVLSYRGLTVGSTISAGLIGMLLAITVLPNLWLVGIAFGSLYGYEVSKDYNKKPPTGLLGRLVISLGRRLAKAYLKVYDVFHGIWFMYKTGQLSYEYYKRYSKLDERFALGEKMDAWNARFQQGKRNFDQWEKDNEIGRRFLAGMRTAWLVEEQRCVIGGGIYEFIYRVLTADESTFLPRIYKISMKKVRKYGKESRYRIVQWWYDITGWCRRFVAATLNAITGGGSSDLREVLKGIRINISESRMQEIGPRIGAALLALLTVSMVGAMYSIAPRLLGLIAIATGVIWPTWVAELFDRVNFLLEEFKAKGRGEDFQGEAGSPTALSQFGMYDKKKYYFYRRADGSRRWYRTGQPAFRSTESKNNEGWLGGLAPTRWHHERQSQQKVNRI